MSSQIIDENASETEYWNSICEFHKVASPDDPYPCLTNHIACCPMNSILSKKGDLEAKMKAKGCTHAVWAVYTDALTHAIPQCSLVWLTEPPSDEIMHKMFDDRLIHYRLAKFDCAEGCSCHTQAQAGKRSNK